MTTNQDLEAIIFNELYNYYEDKFTRYDDDFEGFVFNDIELCGNEIFLIYDEVLTTKTIYHILDNGNLTLESLEEEYDAEEEADGANSSYDAESELRNSNEEDEETVRFLFDHYRGNEDPDIYYRVNSHITAEVVRDYYEARLQELKEEATDIEG